MNKGHSLFLCIIEQEKRGEKGGEQSKANVQYGAGLCVCVYLYEVGRYCLYFGNLLGLNHLPYILSHANFMGD
jgi:hypothetical protein